MSMELVKIEQLLEKYLEARTSLKEENLLRAYFTSGNVAPHLQEYIFMFTYFKENQTKVLKEQIQIIPLKRRKINVKWFSVAASFTLLLSVYIGKVTYDKHQQQIYLTQVREALYEVSYQLNAGNDALFAVSNTMRKGNEAMNQLKVYGSTGNKVLQQLGKNLN